jgi:hypothetical protein
MTISAGLYLQRMLLVGAMLTAGPGFGDAAWAQSAGVTNPAPPTAPGSVVSPPGADAAPVADVKGFRSALFGMSEADVRAAAAKDFGVSADALKSMQNGAEHTQALILKAQDVLPEGGAAEIAYVLGYKSKKLIQVSITWSKTTDDKLTPERLTSNAESLRTYFLKAGYKPETIVNNAPVSNGLLLFRGSDGAGHTTALVLEGAFSGDKAHPTLSPSGLSLFYLADAKNPDVYRIQPGKF